MKVMVLAVIMLFASNAKADTFHVDAFGSFFGGQQTFTGSFDWDATNHALLNNSLQFTSSGLFGGFTLLQIAPRFANWSDGLNFFQIDFWKYLTPFNNPPSFETPGLFPATISLYTCVDWEHLFFCAEPYGSMAGTHRGEEGSYLNITPVVTPEPATWAMLLIGLALLYVLWCYNHKCANLVQLARGKWF